MSTSGKGDAYWFFGTLLTLKATGADTDGRVMVTENLAPQGAGSPLHVHHNEDEWFYVLEGALRLWVGGTVVDAQAGGFAFGPRDVPHTFEVASPEARFLLVTEPAGFEGFVELLGRPAPSLTIPPPMEPPADLTPIVEAAARFGIEILGPPGLPA
jgi:quercetin dioxygenase-like cupin family protein